MSYSSIVCFEKDGSSFEYNSYHSSWDYGFYIWKKLAKKYLNIEELNIFNDKDVDAVFALADNQKEIEKHDLIALCCTFDYFVVKKENIPKVIKAFEKFNKEHGGTRNIEEQCLDLKEIYNNNATIAVGWHVTSVSCDMWFDYNILENNSHHYLFDELNTKIELGSLI